MDDKEEKMKEAAQESIEHTDWEIKNDTMSAHRAWEVAHQQILGMKNAARKMKLSKEIQNTLENLRIQCLEEKEKLESS